MIKLNDLVRVIDKGYDEDDLDMEMIDLFAGSKAKVTRIINDKMVEITFLDEEDNRIARQERANEVFLTDIEVI